MSYEIAKFEEPKPRVPLRTDVRIRKEFSIGEGEGGEFGEKINNTIRNVEKNGSTTVNQTYDQQTQEARQKAITHLSGLTSGAKFVSTEQKINLQFTGDNLNFEAVKNANYTSKEKLIGMVNAKEQIAAQSASISNSTRKAKKSTLEEKDFRSDFADDELEGENYTYFLDGNLYAGLDSNNPVHVQDTEDYNAFLKHKAYQDLNKTISTTLSHLETLDKDLSAKVQKTLVDIKTKHRDMAVVIANNYEKVDMANEIINIGFDDVFRTPEIYREMSASDQFNTMIAAYENVLRFERSFGMIYGQNTIGTTEKDTYNAAKSFIDEMTKLLPDSSLLFSAAIVGNMSTTFTEKMNLRNMEVSDFEAKEFTDPRDRFTTGFLNHIDKEFMANFKTDQKIEFSQLGADDERVNQEIWSKMITNGYINSEGNISARIDFDDPNLSFDFGIDPSIEASALNTLRQKYYGPFSFDAMDFSTVNDQQKRNIKIFDQSSENYVRIDELVSKINSGENWLEKVDQLGGLNDTLIDMYAHMTGLSETGKGNTTIQGRTTADGKYAVSVSEQGSWQEKVVRMDENGKEITEWMVKEGDPLTIKFKSKEDAQAFADKIYQLIQLGAPLVGIFGEYGHSAIVESTDATADGEISIIKRLAYDDDRYTKSHDYVVNTLELDMAKDSMEKTVINMIGMKDFNRKQDDYSEKEEEHYWNERVRIQDLAERDGRHRAEEKQFKKQQEMKKKQENQAREAAARKKQAAALEANKRQKK